MLRRVTVSLNNKNLLILAGILIGALLLFFLLYSIDSQPHSIAEAQVRAAAAIDLCSAEGDLLLEEGDVPSYSGDDITISGCTFTINGSHSFNSLTIGDGVGVDDSILRQTVATTSTAYKTQLTIAGTTTIFFDGEILMDGRGFPSGYTSDGAGNPTTTNASTGQTGGSHGGGGGEDTIGTPGNTYGSLTQPDEPGAGPGSGSGSGGGHIRLITDDLNLVGSIEADASTGTSSGGGAGGSIWITTTGSLTGNGTISATGGIPFNQNHAAGGGGRIAFYYDSSQPGNGTSLPYTLNAWGGDQPSGGATDADGGAGTVYIEDTNTHTSGQGDIILNNGANTIVGIERISNTPIPDGTYDDLSIRGDVSALNNGSITLNGDLFFDTRGVFAASTLNIGGDLTITDSSTLTHTRATTSTAYRLTVTVSGNTSIDATSKIDTDAKGFEPGYTSDGVGGTTTTNASTSQAGGSHGGVGGDDSLGSPGAAYDSLTQPADPGGGSGQNGGRGGGYLRLITTDLALLGAISSTAPASSFAGGAGGGIWITSTGSLTGTGSISANGGAAVSVNYAGGGGGRIAFYYDSSQPGNTTSAPYTFSAIGGDQPTALLQDGGAGTVYIEDTNTHTAGQGDVIISNGDATIVGIERLSETVIPDGTYDDLTIQGDASVRNNGTITINGNLLFDTRGEFAAETLNISGNLTITDGGNLTHRRASTTTVHRLTVTVTGDTSIDATSTIDTNAKGFEPGYTSDGLGGTTMTNASTSQAGGSHGGVGGDDASGAPGAAYDSLTQPADPGGGSGQSSGRGGGYLRLITSDLDVSGSIIANSNDSSLASGAGGGIWITTTGALTGSGTISTNAGAAVSSNYAAGAGGRIAFYYDSSQPGNSSSPPYTFESIGGDQPGDVLQDGGAGTVYVEDTNSHTAGQGNIFISNGAATVVGRERLSETELPDGTYNNLTIQGDASVKNLGTINLDGDLFFDTRGEFAASTLVIGGDLSVTDNSNLTHRRAGTSTVYRLNVTVTGTALIDVTSTIDLEGKGFQFDYTSDGAGGTTTVGAATSQAGGSHGGRGADDSQGAEGDPFDNFQQPADPGGGSGHSAGRGGGYLRLIAPNLNLAGTISTNAPTSTFAGGAGGGIWITTTGTLTGTGTISANGAIPANNYGAGGGGMIAFYFDSSQSGNSDSPPYTFQAYGGDNAVNPQDGAAGTIFIKDSQQTYGDLTVDNNGIANANRYTPLFVSLPAGLPTSYTVRNLNVINEAQLRIDSPCSGTALTVTGTTDTSGNGLINVIGASGCSVSTAALSVGTTIDNGVNAQAYSEQVSSLGGYAPKTYQCLDGLGGSVITCNTGAGLPSGLTMNSAGVVSGVPSQVGTFNFIVRVTDSDPGGAQVAENTVSFSVGSVPNTPTLVSPGNGDDSGSLTPTLTATYSDPDAGDTGTIDFRVSSSSSGDCLTGTNIVSTGSSAETATNNENASFVVSTTLTAAQTYYWCARANDGAFFDNSGSYTSMGNFVATEPAGSNQKFQAQQPENQQPAETPDTETPTEESPSETEESLDETLEETTTPEIPADETSEEPVIVPEPTQPEETLPTQEQDEAPGDLAPPQQPDPTQEESSQIDDLVDELIQIEDQQSPVPTTSQSEQSPSEVGVETRSQSDGRSFTVEVEDLVLEELLIVTGLATTDEDRIEFSGETSLPNSTVTLIFDDSVFVVVTSDDQGFWEAFVSAEELGIGLGQSAVVSVELIAVKDDLRSDKVSVGQTELSLSGNQQILAEFDSQISESAVITIANRLQESISQFIIEEEQTIQRTLTLATPVVVVSSAPLWGYAPYIPTLSYHFFLWIFGLLGKKGKQGRLYGVAYDSITKEPLALAIVRIFREEQGTKKLMKTIVTDKSGRYESLLESGSYLINVSKPQYRFPSSIVSGNTDGGYQSLSYGNFELNNESISLPDLPLDPNNAHKNWEIAGFFKKLVLGLQNLGTHLALPIMFFGLSSSILLLIMDSYNEINWVLTLVYVFMMIFHLLLRSHPQKAWGIVYDIATGSALSLVNIQLIDPEFGKVVKSRLSDYEGRFAFLPVPGRYIVKASKPGYSQPEVVESTGDLKPIKGELEIRNEGEVIDGDIAMKLN